MNLGAPEILVILVIALLVFGPQRLPEIGRQVGGAMRELRKMQDSVKTELHSAMQESAPEYSKPVSAPLPDTPSVSASETTAHDEPDHTDQPVPELPAPDPGFDGPSGSFR
jgi:Tat protein translocase TatB subunit